jgi:hypothetical protein
MAERGASSTAVAVAMMRAAHQLLDGLPRVLDDTVVVDLIGPQLAGRVREERARYGEPGAMAIRSHVLLRSRFTEDRPRQAAKRDRLAAAAIAIPPNLAFAPIDALFGFVASLPPGSECALTFGGARGPDRPGKPSIATMAAALGERTDGLQRPKRDRIASVVVR